MGPALRPGLSTLLRTAAALLVSVVLGSVLTVLAWPWWGWFEAASGNESLGHSGPATWCYALTSALLFGVWLARFALKRR
jgi:hypothetical protein